MRIKLENKRYKFADFGKFLKRTRKIKYNDIQSFSKAVGIPKKQLYEYESGRIFPPIEKFIKICKCLDKTATYMLSPLLEISQSEKEIIHLYSDFNIKELLKDDEISKLMKCMLLGFELLYKIRKHVDVDEEDAITYLREIHDKLFEEFKLKKFK